MSVIALAATADEYTDPQTNVIYTYEPGQPTASVKAGYDEIIQSSPHSELEDVTRPGSPDAAGDVVILDRFTVGASEYVVTSIGECAFWMNKNIKSVCIPETVIDIENSAFCACSSLTTVQLPDGLTRIAPNLFRSCSQLVSITIPSSVSAIDAYAFAGCGSLASLTLPASLTFIGRGAFNGTPWCDALYNEAPDGPFYIGPQLAGYKGDKPTGELVIKEGTTCVGFAAFSGCNGLTCITFPPSVAYVDYEAFNGCTGLKAVRINDLAAWCGIEFQQEFRSSSNPLSKAHHLYLNSEEVTDLVIPEGVTSIGDYAFDNCTSLASVTIPDGVTSIGTCAFRSCENLTTVTIPPSLSTIGSGAFIWCFNLDAVHISDISAWCGVTLIESAVNPLYYGAHLYLNGEEVSNLVIPEGVTCINDNVFQNFAHLTNVTIPDGVTSIGEQAFYGCSALTRVVFPPSLSSIGDNAFWRCKNIDDIIIPEGITSIGDGVFSECSSLTNITIPEGVTSIGIGAFFHCYSLNNIIIPSSVSSIGQQAFFACRSLTNVISLIDEPFEITDDVFESYNEETYERFFTSATLYVPKGCKARYEATAGWKNFKEIVEMTAQEEYRPFVEDGKVWKFGILNSGNPMKVVDYYYFDGDTVIDGRTCKQMMCQRYVSSDYLHVELPSLSKVGAWFEENQKVYFYDDIKQSMKLKYDFTLEANDTLLINDYYPYEKYVIGAKQSGGIEGFKGVYRDIIFCADEGQNIHSTFWLEGVGGVDGLRVNAYNPTMYEPALFLMSCAVGDEVIYLNDKYEDGATPDGARKGRFDFTHTIKSQPKAPRRGGETQSLSGEYNDLRLDINLTLLDEAYQVSITDETGKMVYKKAVNAGTVVALSIDISSYAKGRYTVTIENSNESFTGEFETQTSGINDAARMNDKGEMINDQLIYNLQGQRLGSLQRGLNIVNGLKIHVK